MKNIFKNKFILISILTIITIFSCFSNVFASGTIPDTLTFTDSEDNSYTLNIPNSFKNCSYYTFCIYKKPNDERFWLTLCASGQSMHITQDRATNNYYIGINDNSASIDENDPNTYMICQNGVGSTIQNAINSFNNNSLYASKITGETEAYYGNADSIILGNIDVIDNNGNTVFHQAPLVPEITKALVEQARTVNPLEQIKVIVPIVIVVIISLIALYKALRLLSQVLGKA